MNLQRRLTLPNDINAIPQLNEFLDTVFEEAGIVDMELTMTLNLAMEEAIVNVMDYAYPNGAEGTVSIDVMTDSELITFVITDSGIPFDPTTAKDVDITLPAEERSIGGLGIHLMRQIMDDIKYERKDDKNILTLRKYLNCESENLNL